MMTAGDDYQYTIMLTETATVVAAEPGWLWVEAERKLPCRQCSKGVSCGFGLFAFPAGSGRCTIGVPITPAHAGNSSISRLEPGAKVIIGMPDGHLVWISLLFYLLPLCTLLGGAVLGQWLFQSEAGSILAGLAGLGGGLVAVRCFGRQQQAGGGCQPTLLGVGESTARASDRQQFENS